MKDQKFVQKVKDFWIKQIKKDFYYYNQDKNYKKDKKRYADCKLKHDDWENQLNNKKTWPEVERYACHILADFNNQLRKIVEVNDSLRLSLDQVELERLLDDAEYQEYFELFRNYARKASGEASSFSRMFNKDAVRIAEVPNPAPLTPQNSNKFPPPPEAPPNYWFWGIVGIVIAAAGGFVVYCLVGKDEKEINEEKKKNYHRELNDFSRRKPHKVSSKKKKKKKNYPSRTTSKEWW